MRQVLCEYVFWGDTHFPELGKSMILSLIVLVPYLSFLRESAFSLGNSVSHSCEGVCIRVFVCMCV